MAETNAGSDFAALAEGHRRAGLIREAEQILQGGLSDHPDCVEGLLVLALVLLEQERGEEARAVLERWADDALGVEIAADPKGEEVFTASVTDGELDHAFDGAEADRENMVNADAIAQQAMREVDFDLAGEMENAIQDFNTFQTSTMRVGSTQLLAHYILPEIILKMKEALPELKLQLNTGLSREILDKVVNFECHVGIIGRIAYPGNVIFKQISKQKLSFVTVEKMKQRIHLKDLSNYPIILRDDGSATREYITNEFARRNIPLDNHISSQNPSAIKRMVQLGMGGAFFPEYAIEEDIREGKFRQVEVAEDLYLSIDLIYLLERKKLKAIQDIVSAVTDCSFLQI